MWATESLMDIYGLQGSKFVIWQLCRLTAVVVANSGRDASDGRSYGLSGYFYTAQCCLSGRFLQAGCMVECFSPFVVLEMFTQFWLALNTLCSFW
jgi:hypothetical protein